MGFQFRKRIKVVPGVNLNITSKGVSSVSVGGNGGTLNIGKKGVKATASIPGTGLLYTDNLTSQVQASETQVTHGQQYPTNRRVGIPLGLGVFFMPYIFAWFLLQRGYSSRARLLSFGWLAWLVFFAFIGSRL